MAAIELLYADSFYGLKKEKRKEKNVFRTW